VPPPCTPCCCPRSPAPWIKQQQNCKVEKT
jgi:hypothetical protein